MTEETKKQRINDLYALCKVNRITIKYLAESAGFNATTIYEQLRLKNISEDRLDVLEAKAAELRDNQ